MSAVAGLGDRPLRGAMLGTGSIAEHHMRAWRDVPGVEIVALANRTRERAEALGRDFGINADRVYDDYRALLEREALDFVDVATAPRIHREQVVAAAERGVHVLCQKPFAGSIDEARAMIAACEAAGVRCVVNENWRWRAWYREVKRLLDAGAVGTPCFARFALHADDVLPPPGGGRPTLLDRQPYTAEMPRLLLFEWGIHLIDVLRFLLGDVRRVYARMGRTSDLVRGEDRALVVLEFDGPLTGLIDVSWGTRVGPDRRLVRGNVDPFVVEGDLGTIELDPHRDDAIVVVDARRRVDVRPARPGRTPAEAYQDSYRAAQGHFIDRLRSGEPAETEAPDNLKTLAATLAAYASAEAGEVAGVLA